MSAADDKDNGNTGNKSAVNNEIRLLHQELLLHDMGRLVAGFGASKVMVDFAGLLFHYLIASPHHDAVAARATAAFEGVEQMTKTATFQDCVRRLTAYLACVCRAAGDVPITIVCEAQADAVKQAKQRVHAVRGGDIATEVKNAALGRDFTKLIQLAVKDPHAQAAFGMAVARSLAVALDSELVVEQQMDGDKGAYDAVFGATSAAAVAGADDAEHVFNALKAVYDAGGASAACAPTQAAHSIGRAVAAAYESAAQIMGTIKLAKTLQQPTPAEPPPVPKRTHNVTLRVTWCEFDALELSERAVVVSADVDLIVAGLGRGLSEVLYIRRLGATCRTVRLSAARLELEKRLSNLDLISQGKGRLIAAIYRCGNTDTTVQLIARHRLAKLAKKVDKSGAAACELEQRLAGDVEADANLLGLMAKLLGVDVPDAAAESYARHVAARRVGLWPFQKKI